MTNKKIVLVVEDDKVLRKVAEMQLLRFGIPLEVKTVQHGKRAVEAVELDGIHLVLMDIQMPEMDGLTATRQIRQIERSKNKPRVPIVGVSANPDLKKSALQAGMDDFVLKPADYARIAERWLL